MRKKNILLAISLFIGFGLFFTYKNSPPLQKNQTNRTLRVTQTVFIKNTKTTSSFSFTPGETALQLLNKTHSIQTIGKEKNAFITVIDGEKADSKKEFWSFSVNGKQAEVGAGSYLLKNNDTIEWKIEAFAL